MENTAEGQITGRSLRLEHASKMTIFIGKDARYKHRRLHEYVLSVLQQENVSGATVIEGDMAFGAARRIHSMQNEIAMDNLPIIIEVVDDRKKIDEVALKLAEVLTNEGLIDVQPTTLVIASEQGGSK